MKIQFLLISAFFFSTIALAEPAAGDHAADQGAGVSESAKRSPVDVESIFQKHKQRYTETVASLKEAAETLQRLQKEKNNPPTIILSVALASELLRLKQEEALIKAWEDGTIDKAEYVTLMAENTFILENLEMFAAFAKSTYAAWENRTGVVTEKALLLEAAKGFGKYYTAADKLAAAYYDVELRDNAAGGRKTLETFKRIFEQGDDFRAKHFARYAENLIKKNEALIREGSKPKAP